MNYTYLQSFFVFIKIDINFKELILDIRKTKADIRKDIQADGQQKTAD